MISKLRDAVVYLFWLAVALVGFFFVAKGAVNDFDTGVTDFPFRPFRQFEVLRWRDGQLFWVCILIDVAVAIGLLVWACLILRNMIRHMRLLSEKEKSF